MRYLRFVVAKINKESLAPTGVFHALDDLLYDGLLSPEEEKNAEALFKWFKHNLKRPGRLTTSKNPRGTNNAISWFKSSALVHIEKLREIIAILEHHDVAVRMVQTAKPGYVVYEDKYQIVAAPFSDTEVGEC